MQIKNLNWIKHRITWKPLKSKSYFRWTYQNQFFYEPFVNSLPK